MAASSHRLCLQAQHQAAVEAADAAAQTEREQTSRELSAAEEERAAAVAALESQLAALQADHAAESDAVAVRHRETLANEQAKARL